MTDNLNRYALILLLAVLSADYASGYLRIHPSDPHYFQETTTGEPVVCTSHGNIVPNEATYDDEAGFRATSQSWRMMYARSWHFTPWSVPNAIWPWADSGVGGGYWGGYGGNKLDLNTWNPTCWTRHKDSIARCENAGVYVQIMLFDRCGMSPGTDSRWGGNPWAANNNINNLEVPNANPPNDGTPDFYYYASKPNLRNQQERYVRKMIDETIVYGNVIYEVENEHWDHNDIGWCDYWCLFIKNYIGSNYPGSPRLTSYNSLENDLDDAYYLGALDIVNKHYGGSAESNPGIINDYLESKWHHNKPVNINEFANGLTDTNILREMCWTILAGGGHFHVEDAHSDSKPFEVVDNIMRFKSYANWDFIGASPSDNLIVSGGGYCLAKSGVDYLCYFPSGGNKTVNLASGSYRAEWWNPRTGGFYNVTTFGHGGGNKTLSAPDSGDWVLHVTTAGAKTAELESKAAGTITIDGNNSDWSLGEFTTNICAGDSGEGDTALMGYHGYQKWSFYNGAHATANQFPPDNPDDTAVDIYSRNDSDYLYFLVRFYDDDVETPYNTDTNWANDCIEIYIDPSNDGGASAISNSTSDIQLVIDAANRKNVYMTTSAYKTQVLNGVTSAVNTVTGGWWLEIGISKSALDPDIPATGIIGIDFNVRDNDDSSAPLTTIYTWRDPSTGVFPSKVPDRWGKLELQEGGPPDTTSPGPVTQFTAVAGTGQVALSWTNPSDADFTGTMIRYKTTGCPTGPTDGSLVVDKANIPASNDSFLHSGRTNGTTYYYVAFAHDAIPNYSTAENANATPAATIDADLDNDLDVDQEDFGRLQQCYTGDGVLCGPECSIADLDGDGDVDVDDVAVFQGCMAGPNDTPPPGC